MDMLTCEMYDEIELMHILNSINDATSATPECTT